MTVYLFILLVMLISAMCFKTNGECDETCLSKDKNRYWKGVFVLLIMMSHFTGYITPDTSDEIYLTFRNCMGQTVVSIFFFYTGFGMMTRLKEKGIAYTRTIPKRFVRIYLTAAICILLLLITQLLRGREYDAATIVMAFLCWANIGNSSWFVFVTLVMYLLFALSSVWILIKKPMGNLLCVMMLTGLTVLFIRWMQGVWLQEYWYDTVLLLPVGAWWAVLRQGLHRRIVKSPCGFTWVAVAVMAAVAWFFTRRDFSFYLHEGWIISFTLAVVLLSTRVTPVNPLFAFCGDHALTIYLIQRIPMIIAYETGLTESAPHMSFLPVAVLTFALSMILDHAMGKLCDRLWKTGKIKT